MNTKSKLVVFFAGLILALVYWRIRIFLFFNNGEMSILRELTGLKIHHYHYGIILLTIALLIYIFYKESNIALFIIGVGLGSLLDRFSSSLFRSSSRAEELINYNLNLGNTVLIFLIVILFSLILHFIKKR